MPFDEPAAGDYCVLVSRVEDRPRAEFWPLGLRDRGPKFPFRCKPASRRSAGLAGRARAKRAAI
jgi:hypothetical protein